MNKSNSVKLQSGYQFEFCNLQFVFCNSGRGGFTLIEVLLSITLLVIVLGVVYSSFFTVHRAIERFDGVSLKYHEVRTVLDIMRREIEGAFLETSDAGRNQTGLVIEDRDIYGKTTSRLHLTAFSFKGNGLSITSYYVDEKDGKLILIKDGTPTFTLLTDKDREIGRSSGGYALEMVEGIESFTVETLFNNKWVKTWDTKQTESLPEIVRLSIEFDDKGKKVILTEHARPKVGNKL